jgi:hypothetical protein
MRTKKTTTTSKIKVIHESKIVNRDVGRLSRFFELNGKKFKLVYDLRNGVSNVDVYVMDSNGEFKYILNKLDIGHTHTVSYVGYEKDKERDILNAVKLVDEVVSKIYQD